MKLISQSKFAKLCKISRQAIFQKVQSGFITLDDGKIDLDKYNPEVFSHKTRNIVASMRFDKYIRSLE